MITGKTTPAVDDRVSAWTGEFIDEPLEQTFLSAQWPIHARRIRIVLLVATISYLFAFYQNYLDLGNREFLWGIGAVHLLQFIAFGWGILESFAPAFSSRLQYIVFFAEVLTGLSETVEMVSYQLAGFTINLVSAPFFAFLILIFYIFVRIRLSLTTLATLLGSAMLYGGYYYIASDHLESIVRQPVMLLGLIVMGASMVRGMNRVDRHEWLQSKRLKIEISERRRAEIKALEASRAKGEFLAVMSHEIRTPLNSILAMSELLLADRKQQNDHHKRLLNILSTAGRHLNDLIEDILDFSRIEAKANNLAHEPLDLRKTVDKAITAVRHQANRKNLPLNVVIDASIPDLLVGDDQRIRQILINLVGNAIKFTDNGSVELRITRHDERVLFTVTDTGIGIPDKDLTRIFEPFQQSDSSTTRQYEGTGLGLAISQNLAQQMGGTITARNNPEGGAVFEFQLPLRIAENQAARTADKQPVVTAKLPTTHFKVLVVEDSELNRLVMEEFLAGADCDLQFTNNGRQGLEAFQKGHFDIVLMDMQMPEMDGATTSRLIRDWERRHGRKPVPIVIITADSQTETRERAMNAGVNGFLTKPLSQSALFETLNLYLAASSIPADTQEQAHGALAPLLPRYFEQTEQDIQHMTLAVEHDDIERLNGLAHVIKGHSQMFGFSEVAKAATELETLTESANAPTPQLHATWEKLRDAFVEISTQR